ncbi:hypothetical protein [Candidatus Formimonas warabiya]|nr:hypothetical protein [Candidatus Formimonas warabiya]
MAKTSSKNSPQMGPSSSQKNTVKKNPLSLDQSFHEAQASEAEKNSF